MCIQHYPIQPAEYGGFGFWKILEVRKGTIGCGHMTSILCQILSAVEFQVLLGVYAWCGCLFSTNFPMSNPMPRHSPLHPFPAREQEEHIPLGKLLGFIQAMPFRSCGKQAKRIDETYWNLEQRPSITILYSKNYQFLGSQSVPLTTKVIII